MGVYVCVWGGACHTCRYDHLIIKRYVPLPSGRMQATIVWVRPPSVNLPPPRGVTQSTRTQDGDPDDGRGITTCRLVQVALAGHHSGRTLAAMPPNPTQPRPTQPYRTHPETATLMRRVPDMKCGWKASGALAWLPSA